MQFHSCAFTGHRPDRYAWGYDESDSACCALKEQLRGEIIKLCRAGVRDYYSGLAMGADLWAAEIVLSLTTYFEGLRLHAAIPFPGQELSWEHDYQERYRRVLNGCASRAYMSQHFKKASYLERNEYLVDHCDILIAVYDPNRELRSGTRHTVNYALKKCRPVIYLHPVSGEVSLGGDHAP